MTVSGELAPGYSHIAPQIFTLRLSEFFLSPPQTQTAEQVWEQTLTQFKWRRVRM